MTLILTVRNSEALPKRHGPVFYGRRRHGRSSAARAIATGTCPTPSNVVSSRHCEIRRDGDAWLLKDISTNGTFLNERRRAARRRASHRRGRPDPDRPLRAGRHASARRRRRPSIRALGHARPAARSEAPAPAPEPAPEPEPAPAAEALDEVPDNVTVMWDSLADINKVDWARGGFGVKDAAPGRRPARTVDGDRPGR